MVQSEIFEKRRQLNDSQMNSSQSIFTLESKLWARWKDLTVIYSKQQKSVHFFTSSDLSGDFPMTYR
jgi:hypothetical protein